MAEERKLEMDLMAWFDGQLGEERSGEIEAMLDSDPSLLDQIQGMKLCSSAIAHGLEEAEARADMAALTSGIMASIDSSEESTSQIAVARKQDPGSTIRSLCAWFVDLISVRAPALAAVAMLFVIVGGGSFYYLVSHVTQTVSFEMVEVRGGATTIEELSFSDSGAIVFKTESDVTVIWVTED